MDNKTLISDIEKFLNTKYIMNNSKHSDELRILLNRMNEKQFKIAIVGEFSSGKSTFINAVLGKDILKHESKETTACITYIENSSVEDNIKIEVYMSDGQIKEIESIDEIAEYTTTNSKNINVCADINYVHIKKKFLEDNKEIILVDTPGLNGNADKHRGLTIEEVKNAHACIYLLQLRSLSDSDLEFIRYLTDYQSNFIFVQNFIDEIKSSEGETIEGKLNGIIKILDEKIFGQLKDGYCYEVCGVSSLKALASRDKNIKRLYAEDTKDIGDDERIKIWKDSRFDNLLSLLSKRFGMEKYLEVKINAVTRTFKVLAKKIEHEALKQLNESNEAVKHSRDRSQLDEMVRRRVNLLERRERNKERIHNFIQSESGKIKRLLKDKSKATIKNRYNIIAAEINNENNYEKFKAAVNNGSYAKKVQLLLYDIDDEIYNDMKDCMQQLYYNVLLRIEELFNWKKEINLKDENILQIEKVNGSYDTFETEKGYALKLKQDIEGKRLNIDKSEVENKSLYQEIISDSENINASYSKIKNVENTGKTQIRAKGNRPDSITRERTDTSYEKRGGLGIADFFLGSKKVTKTVYYEDDSQGLEWDREIREINERINIQKDAINRQISRINSEKSQKESMIKANQAQQKLAEESLKRLEKQLKSKEEEIKFLEDKAKKEFLQAQKNNLKMQLENYLFNGDNPITEIKNEQIDININNNIGLIVKKTEYYFDEAYINNLFILDQTISGKTEELLSQVQYLKEVIQICKKVRDKDYGIS